MSRNLLKRVTALEDELWAKAQLYIMPSDVDVKEFLEATVPLDTPLFNLWAANDPQAGKLDAQQQRILDSLPPTHPAFIPDYADTYRRHQWGLYHSKEYRESSEATWFGFSSFVRARFDLTAGLMEIARQLFAEDIDRITAEMNYIGFPTSRDEVADTLTRQWKHVGLARIDTPDASNDDVWLRASLANELEVLGRTMTGEELLAEWAQWRQVAEDMKAGRPAGELAAKLRAICEAYPRRVKVGEFRRSESWR